MTLRETARQAVRANRKGRSYMDIRTGKTYDTYEAARADGVPASDIAHVEQRLADGKLIVECSQGSFKSFRRDEAGALVRV